MQNSKTPEATPAYSYPQFTEEMRKTYKILVPNMLPVQLGLICRLMKNYGYDMELLHTEGPNIAEQGLRNVHNDTCYPALLVIGQLMDAIESGKYDIHKIALILPQTGGGCRASNYIHLLRKALEKNGLRLHSGHFAELFRSGEQPRLQADQDHARAGGVCTSDR